MAANKSANAGQAPGSPKATEKRACDACAYRRVRCDGTKPVCSSCKERDLDCKYERVPKKKGPAGKRLAHLQHKTAQARQSLARSQPRVEEGSASPPSETSSAFPTGPTFANNHFDHLVSDLFADQSPMSPADQSLPASAPYMSSLSQILRSAPHVHPRTTNIPSQEYDTVTGLGLSQADDNFWSYLDEPSSATSTLNQLDLEADWPTSSIISPAPVAAPLPFEEGLEAAVDVFFDTLDPTVSVFKKDWLMQKVVSREYLTNNCLYGLLLSIKALVLIQPIHGHEWNLPPDSSATFDLDESRQAVVRKALAIRTLAPLGENPSVEGLMGAFYLFACFFGLQQSGEAWIRLQEAISIAQLLRVEDIQAYDHVGILEQEHRLKAYWLLAVTERAFALQRNHSVAFRGSLARLDSQIALKIVQMEQSDFLQKRLFLFDRIDEKILFCWNGECKPNTCTQFSRQTASSIYRRLADPVLHLTTQYVAEVASWDSHHSIQAADLWITAKWLQDRLWNLALSHHLVVVDPQVEEVFNAISPLAIAKAALVICNLLPLSSLEACGLGLVEKVYHMVQSTITVCKAWPLLRQTHLEEHEDILRNCANFFALFRNGQHPYVDRLEGMPMPYATAYSAEDQQRYNQAKTSFHSQFVTSSGDFTFRETYLDIFLEHTKSRFAKDPPSHDLPVVFYRMPHAKECESLFMSNSEIAGIAGNEAYDKARSVAAVGAYYDTGMIPDTWHVLRSVIMLVARQQQVIRHRVITARKVFLPTFVTGETLAHCWTDEGLNSQLCHHLADILASSCFEMDKSSSSHATGLESIRILIHFSHQQHSSLLALDLHSPNRAHPYPHVEWTHFDAYGKRGHDLALLGLHTAEPIEYHAYLSWTRPKNPSQLECIFLQLANIIGRKTGFLKPGSEFHNIGRTAASAPLSNIDETCCVMFTVACALWLSLADFELGRPMPFSETDLPSLRKVLACSYATGYFFTTLNNEHSLFSPVSARPVDFPRTPIVSKIGHRFDAPVHMARIHGQTVFVSANLFFFDWHGVAFPDTGRNDIWFSFAWNHLDGLSLAKKQFPKQFGQLVRNIREELKRNGQAAPTKDEELNISSSSFHWNLFATNPKTNHLMTASSYWLYCLKVRDKLEKEFKVFVAQQKVKSQHSLLPSTSNDQSAMSPLHSALSPNDVWNTMFPHMDEQVRKECWLFRQKFNQVSTAMTLMLEFHMLYTLSDGQADRVRSVPDGFYCLADGLLGKTGAHQWMQLHPY